MNNNSTDSINNLKRLFCDHFNIDDSAHLLEDKHLDFSSLNLIFQTWIQKLSFTDDQMAQSHTRANYIQNLKKEYKINKELRNSIKQSKKLDDHHNQSSLEDNSLIATSSSSSLPSLNSSDDDANSSKLNSNSNSDFEHLEQNDELISENLRLKQTIYDLKQQLSNAEDLNAQMGHDCEQLNKRTICLNKVNNELATKLTKYTEENENTTRQMEHYKQKIEQLIADNKHITTDVRMYKSKCSSYENEIFNLKSQIETNEFDKESLQIDLNDQKSILNQTESYNSKLEQNLIEVTFCKIVHKL